MIIKCLDGKEMAPSYKKNMSVNSSMEVLCLRSYLTPGHEPTTPSGAVDEYTKALFVEILAPSTRPS